MLQDDFDNFLNTQSASSNFKVKLGISGGFVNFSNTSEKYFTISLESLLQTLIDIRSNLKIFSRITEYVESNWRDNGSKYFKDSVSNAFSTVQTKPLFTTLGKIIRWANNDTTIDDNKINISESALDNAIIKLENVIKEYTPVKTIKMMSSNKPLISNRLSAIDLYQKTQQCGFKYSENISKNLLYSIITKSFVIITGNSGTGKTKLAQLLAIWLSGRSDKIKYKKLFIPGLDINAKQSVYKIVAVDNYSLIIDQGGSSTKTVLPYELIEFWIDVIIKYGFNIDTPSQEIEKKVVENGISYSSTINSFHSPLKALAFYVIKNYTSLNIDQDLSLNTYCLLPVGAGWTDSRPILGFYNSLQNIYQTTPALELILDAAANPDLPFFLILDEMNLSHVERYFSDFLSAMESGEEIPLHTHGDAVISPDGTSVPERIAMPQNLFVVGTVNVDETTYMFSPKVLDRANVIEFRVTDDDILKYFSDRKTVAEQIQPAEPGTAEAFLSLSKRARSLELPELPEAAEISQLESALQDVFKILQKRGFEFAYRSASEIIRFASVSYELTELDSNGKKKWDIKEVIDTQILQKLLPKLHGSRKKMEHLLAALAQYCIDANLETALKQFEKCDVKIDMPVDKDSPVVYKNSYRKLAEMLESVRRDQFVSFIQ